MSEPRGATQTVASLPVWELYVNPHRWGCEYEGCGREATRARAGDRTALACEEHGTEEAWPYGHRQVS